jgi:hypothetical protein
VEDEAQRHVEGLRQEGDFDSSGAFTLSSEKALQKLAAYQLPDRGLWALKVVQAVVASGSTQPIRINQDRAEIIVRFEPESDWSLDRIEAKLRDPAPAEPADPGERSLHHLAIALWSVAIGEGRGFLLRTPNESLSWKNGQIIRQPTRLWFEKWRLTVPHSAQGTLTARELLTRLRAAFRPNLEVHQALVDRAFACPVPLTIDGLRIDGWHQRRSGDIPLIMAVGPGRSPVFEPPASTLDKLSEARPGWRRAGQRVVPEFSLAMLVTALPLAAGRARPLPCSLCWLVDGAVLEIESSLQPLTPCWATIYVSAVGLPTDLTSLALKRDKVYAAQRAQALNWAGKVLLSLVPKQARSYKFFGFPDAGGVSLHALDPSIDLLRFDRHLVELAKQFPSLWGSSI